MIVLGFLRGHIKRIARYATNLERDVVRIRVQMTRPFVGWTHRSGLIELFVLVRRDTAARATRAT